MFNKLSSLFQSSHSKAQQQFMQTHGLEWNEQDGYILAGIILNREYAERLEYLSNRRLKSFDSLEALYSAAMIINEKIDLEIATGRYVTRLGNTHENLLEFKRIIKLLNDYYRTFIRDHKKR